MDERTIRATTDLRTVFDQIKPSGTSLVKTREFPDTEPFVDAASRLVAGDGLYVVGDQTIVKLSLSRA